MADFRSECFFVLFFWAWWIKLIHSAEDVHVQTRKGIQYAVALEAEIAIGGLHQESLMFPGTQLE